MRLRDILWAGLAGLAASAILHSTALVLATLAGSAIAVLFVTTRRRVFNAFTFDRVPSRRVVSWGGELEIILSITNDKLLPLVWVRIRDEWPAGLEPQGFELRQTQGRQIFTQTVSLRWYERLRRHYRVRCVERGLHRLGPVELEAGDPLGIAGVEGKFTARQEFAVLPKVLDVRDFELFSGRPLVDEVAVRSFAADPTALRGARPYRQGDPMRAINWRASARSDALYVNEFDPASQGAVRLLLDAGSVYGTWERIDPALMELLCVVAATLATALAAHGYAVGLASNACLANKRCAADVQPVHGALPDVLETLARVGPHTAGDYDSVLAAELVDEGSADCVAITATLRPAVRDLILRMRAERHTTVVFVGSLQDDDRTLTDFVIPGDFDWRTSDALPLDA